MMTMSESVEPLADDDALLAVGHDLRGPVCTIASTATLLLDGARELPRAQQEGLERISRVASFTLALIDNFVDAIRLGYGLVSLRKAQADLAGLVAEAVEAARPMAVPRGIGLRLHVPCERVAAMVDANKIVRVVANLLFNAIRFSPRGSPVDVYLEAEATEARITVVDRGEGIPPEQLTRLFRRFETRPPSRAPTQGGLGLGLYISRQFVRLHGGRIEVESAPGAGARFRVRLPLP